MAFDSFAEFLAMGKHGFYVWLVYGVSLLTLLVLVVSTQSQAKRQRREVELAAQVFEDLSADRESET